MSAWARAAGPSGRPACGIPARTPVQIAAILEHAKEHLHLVAVIDDLKYLRKGGRLPAAVAVAGGMLGIKPLITIKEGKVAMAGKARGLPVPMWPCSRRSRNWAASALDFAAVAGYSSSLREVQPIENYFRENLLHGRTAGAPDRLRHRYPRRSRCVWSGLL